VEKLTLSQLRNSDPAVRRQAIIVLGRSQNPAALKPLEGVSCTDPDPKLRELARKAMQYIQRSQTTAPPPSVQPLPRISPQPSPDISPQAERRAKHSFDQALDAHVAGDRTRTLKELMQALALNPKLAEDDVFTNLAGQVLNLPPQQAVQALLSRSGQAAPAAVAKAPANPKRKAISRWLLLVATLVLAVMVVWFVDSGLFARYKLAYRTWRLKQNVQTLANGQEYYLIIPGGDAPPDGWAVVVAMHGYGGDGVSILSEDFFDIAEKERAIIVLPTFTDYDDDDDTFTQINVGLQSNLTAILNKLAKDYPVSSKGAVLYGFSRGAMFATEYFSNYSAQVSAIGAEAAPQVIIPPVGTYLRPCVFLYGANDGLQNYTYSSIQQWEVMGYTVTYEIVPDAGHEVTPRGMHWVREMIRRVHAG